jgi:RNA polymerase sigma-70 factor (ECF subfamily)
MNVKEQAELVDGLLQSLPPEYRACLLLREVEGLTYAQIAEHLEIPIGTVMSRLSRGRQELRDRLRAAQKQAESPGIEPAGRLSKTSEDPSGDELR